MKSKWRVTRWNKRRPGRTGSLAHYLSGLRRTDAPHTYVDLTIGELLWSHVDQKSIENITINLSVKVNKSMPHNILVRIPHTIFPIISHRFPNCRQFLFVSIVMFFPTFSVLVANPNKTTLHGGRSRSLWWSAEQGKENRIKRRGSKPPPARHSFGEKMLGRLRSDAFRL